MLPFLNLKGVGGMLTKDYVLTFVKEFNDIADDTDIFDKKLNLLISAEMGKLSAEGITNSFDESTELGDMYCLCVAEGVRIAMNQDMDYDMLSSMSLDNRIILRNALLAGSND